MKSNNIKSHMNSVQQGIYLAERGENFKSFIVQLLSNLGVKQKYVNILTEDMSLYSHAFTSDSIDEINNYQVFEQIGDLLGNKFIVVYMYKRFPQLKCTEGVKVAARLRINYGAKQSFYKIAEEYGFWKWISATKDLRQRKMKDLLEDVFEAFLGVTEWILDDKIRNGIGYAIVYDMLKIIFDKIHISLEYEDLYDPKTRIKELFDLYEDTIGPLIYKESRDPVSGVIESSLYRVENGQYETRANGTINKKRIVGGKHIHIGSGTAMIKSDAQQNGAANALRNLNKQGWYKPVPVIYDKFAHGNAESDIITPDKLIDRWGIICTETGKKILDINDQQSTREKIKYNSKYTSTLLCMYCRKKNIIGIKICMEMGADPNITDSEGLYPIDHFVIGNSNQQSTNKILEIIGQFTVHKIKGTLSVFQMYTPGITGSRLLELV